jgi:hypothetical protein
VKIARIDALLRTTMRFHKYHGRTSASAAA